MVAMNYPMNVSLWDDTQVHIMQSRRDDDDEKEYQGLSPCLAPARGTEQVEGFSVWSALNAGTDVDVPHVRADTGCASARPVQLHMATARAYGDVGLCRERRREVRRGNTGQYDPGYSKSTRETQPVRHNGKS